MTSALGFAVANMDPSVNPAHDFYRFAAGRWVDQTIIPDTEGQVNGFVGLYRQVNRQILDLLQNAAANSATAPHGSVEQQVGDLFASAMDTARLDALGIAPLQSEFARIDAMTTSAELAATLAHLMSITGSPILMVPYVRGQKTKRPEFAGHLSRRSVSGQP